MNRYNDYARNYAANLRWLAQKTKGESTLCLSSVDEIIAVLTDLKAAKLAREKFDRAEDAPVLLGGTVGSNVGGGSGSNGPFFFTADISHRNMEVTIEEGRDLLDRRIAALEAKCRELGCHGPAPKADPGESQFTTHKR